MHASTHAYILVRMDNISARAPSYIYHFGGTLMVNEFTGIADMEVVRRVAGFPKEDHLSPRSIKPGGRPESSAVRDCCYWIIPPNLFSRKIGPLEVDLFVSCLIH